MNPQPADGGICTALSLPLHIGHQTTGFLRFLNPIKVGLHSSFIPALYDLIELSATLTIFRHGVLFNSDGISQGTLRILQAIIDFP